MTKIKYPIAKVGSLLVIVLCVIVFAGWQFDIVLFRNIIPKSPQTTPLTALTLLLLAAAIYITAESRESNSAAPKVLSIALACLVLLSSLWTGIQYLFNLKPDIEIAMYTEAVLKQSVKYPGRPSPRTAISSFIFALALLFSFSKSVRYRQISNTAVYIGMIIPWIAVFGYISLARAFYALPSTPETGMSPITALCFLSTGVAIMGLFPEEGLIALFKKSTSAGEILRKKMPLALLVPVILSLWFNRHASVEVAVSWAFTSVFMVILIFYGSWIIQKGDREKEKLVEDLRNAEKRVHKTLESAPDAMIVVNDNGQIIMVNGQAEAVFGYDRQELLNKAIEMLIPDKFRTGHINYRNDYTKRPTTRRMGEGLDLYGKHKDGHEFPVEISLSPIHIDEETWICAAVRDITDRKEHEMEIINLNKELEAFSYSVSHDLRAPLRSINGYTEILEEDYEDKFDNDGKEILGVIKRNASKMGMLIDDLLAFSRLGRQSLQKQRIDTENLVNTVIEEISQNQHASSSQWVIPKTLPSIYADRSFMHQVFINLLSNALKYSSKTQKPVIEVGAIEKPRNWVFYVKDNGVGFDMKYKDKLFQVFQRLHKMEEYEGTGVGLAIVKRIIDKHGGQVWAEGIPNQGATFYFSIPERNLII